MKTKIRYRGQRYVVADGVAGFADDLNHFTSSCLPQVEALMERARKLKMKKVMADLKALRDAISLFSKREPPDLTLEMSVAASSRKD